MRLLNVFAALSGVVALIMLVIAAHALRETLTPEALERIKLGAFVQLIAATTGLALANRENRLNLIAGAMILGGAALFSGALFALSLIGEPRIAVVAPVGGVTLIAGWTLLAFAKPR